MRTRASVRQKGMKRNAENNLAKALGFEYADVRDFVSHLELDATCCQELLFLREMWKALHDSFSEGASIVVLRDGKEVCRLDGPSKEDSEQAR